MHQMIDLLELRLAGAGAGAVAVAVVAAVVHSVGTDPVVLSHQNLPLVVMLVVLVLASVIHVV